MLFPGTFCQAGAEHPSRPLQNVALASLAAFCQIPKLGHKLTRQDVTRHTMTWPLQKFTGGRYAGVRSVGMCGWRSRLGSGAGIRQSGAGDGMGQELRQCL